MFASSVNPPALLITSICCLSNTIGVMFGYIVHTFVMEENTVNPIIFKKEFKSYLIVEFIITIVFCAVFIIFMREKPKNPPSNSQKNRDINIDIFITIFLPYLSGKGNKNNVPNTLPRKGTVDKITL